LNLHLKMSSTQPKIKSIPRHCAFGHWLSAIVITGSLLTVLANSTITNGRKNAAIIKTELSKNKVAVNPDQARSAAHEISDQVWALHTYFGYGLAALLLFRIVVELFQPGDQKLIPKIKSAYNHYFVIRQKRELARHEFFVKTLYAVFYLLLMIMAITGLCLAFEDDVALLKKIHAIREIHGFLYVSYSGFYSCAFGRSVFSRKKR
jgi:Ni/Fe-hydrogenase 1 B-type cytochrome subunit